MSHHHQEQHGVVAPRQAKERKEFEMQPATAIQDTFSRHGQCSTERRRARLSACSSRC